MYLSNRDIRWAIQRGLLIVNPPPDEEKTGYDETSIDLHLDDTAKAARVWDMDAFRGDQARSGNAAELRLGTFHFKNIAKQYLKEVPEGTPDSWNPVFARGKEVIVKPTGFVLWTTHEWVGTSEDNNPQLICFVNAKSTRARTGVVVHLSAPTIHAGWQGNITLEVVNFGPFDLVLKPGDVIAQLTVATVSSPPDLDLKIGESATARQTNPSASKPGKRKK